MNQFIAIASGVPAAPAERAMVLTAIEPSLAQANWAKERLLLQLGDQVRARGGHVVDVET